MGVDAFERFFEREYPGVHRSLVAALGDVAAADDAAQEAFLRAWLRWGRLQQMDRASAWVYVVAVRHALRRRGRSREDAMAEVAHGDTEDGMADDVAAVVDTTRLLLRLTERQRLVIVLRYYADLQLDEIADAIGRS